TSFSYKFTALLAYFSALYYHLYWLSSHDEFVRHLGASCSLVNTVFMLLPLLDIGRMLASRDAGGTHLPILLAGALCSGLWSLYGQAIGDFNVVLPNLMGVSSAVACLIVRFYIRTAYPAAAAAAATTTASGGRKAKRPLAKKDKLPLSNWPTPAHSPSTKASRGAPFRGGGSRGGPPRGGPRGRGGRGGRPAARVPYGDHYRPDPAGRSEEFRAQHQRPGSERSSLVVMARDLPANVSEADLSEAFGRIGRISRIWTMPHKRRALVEFQEQRSVARTFELAKSGALGGIHVVESSIIRIMHRGDGFPAPNRVLLLVFYRAEPSLPVSMEMLHAACSRFGQVCRAVMFRKGPSCQLHAMVEFAHIEQAVTAKARLNGLDFFDGCCTVKVDFALPPELTIVRNTPDAFDFTRDPSIQQEPGPPHRVTPVLLLSGLDSGVFTCDRLFNLICLYGNVIGICLLSRPPGQQLPPGQPPPPPGPLIGAYVEVGDVASACRVGSCLDGARMFGSCLRVSPTPLARLTKDSAPHGVALDRALPDKSPGFVDYSDCANNRFTTPRQAASNKPAPPFRTLYYWNCPPGIQEHQLRRVFDEAKCPLPTSTLRFSNARATDKSSGGMAQWPNAMLSTEALVLANNRELVGLGQQERGGNFVLRLRFADRAIGQKEDAEQD
uniref:Sugar transporter SWEET1 n=2 Tax=Macrostomum lignano TaxID=282301 RepID=A0A1I8J8L3_9PLAT